MQQLYAGLGRGRGWSGVGVGEGGGRGGGGGGGRVEEPPVIKSFYKNNLFISPLAPLKLPNQFHQSINQLHQ